jgi:hypothetical protein
MKKLFGLSVALLSWNFAISQTLQTAYDNSRFIQTAPNLPVVIKAGNGGHGLQIWGRSDGHGYLEFYGEFGSGPQRAIYGYGESLHYSAPSHNFIGNVGIGTSNASSLLELGSATPIITLTPASYNGLYKTSLGTRASAQGFLILGNNGQNEIRAGNSAAGGYLDFFTNNMVSQESESNGNHVMRMAANGNVGIGTTSPREKLSVNGKIRAHEIKVETTNWPDYVFTKDYALPSLAEMEKHIKEKGHLSGIPSATEVKVNGIDLGEMNAKLLQKIEELTLYLIEQNKIIVAQNEKFEAKISLQDQQIKHLLKQK